MCRWSASRRSKLRVKQNCGSLRSRLERLCCWSETKSSIEPWPRKSRWLPDKPNKSSLAATTFGAQKFWSLSCHNPHDESRVFGASLLQRPWSGQLSVTPSGDVSNFAFTKRTSVALFAAVVCCLLIASTSSLAAAESQSEEEDQPLEFHGPAARPGYPDAFQLGY